MITSTPWPRTLYQNWSTGGSGFDLGNASNAAIALLPDWAFALSAPYAFLYVSQYISALFRFGTV
jgi:hypothetical protein